MNIKIQTKLSARWRYRQDPETATSLSLPALPAIHGVVLREPNPTRQSFCASRTEKPVPAPREPNGRPHCHPAPAKLRQSKMGSACPSHPCAQAVMTNVVGVSFRTEGNTWAFVVGWGARRGQRRFGWNLRCRPQRRRRGQNPRESPSVADNVGHGSPGGWMFGPKQYRPSTNEGAPEGAPG